MHLARENARSRQTAQIFIPFSQTATAYTCRSRSLELNGVREVGARAQTYTHSAHAQGGGDSAAALITPNSSIRRTVVINPVESPLLPSVTCQAAASPPALLH